MTVKNNRLRFFAYATAIIAVACFFSYILYNYSNNWHQQTLDQCNNAEKSVKNLLPAVYQINICKRLGWSKIYYITANKNVKNGSPPMNMTFSASRSIIDKAVVFVQGGPGAPTLGLPLKDSALWKIAAECNAAVIMPSYSGSFERSNYPDSSHEDAEREIGKLMSDLSSSGKVRISILADSLGANIISSRDVPIPAGNHFINVPLLRSPNDAIDYFTSDLASRDERRWAINLSQEYYIDEGPRRIIKVVSVMDFLKAYFGTDQSYLNETFMDRWQKKKNIDASAKFHAVVARDDHKAGGVSYAADLKKLGFSVEIVEGKHERTDDNGDRFDLAFEQFKSQVCAD